ncbi:MAG: ABC transporter ATP-binding protein [Pelagibacteraceae bacterium]|nr:ABC transporter ATP-binding protein [Pelagibacteraceae bacterium]
MSSNFLEIEDVTFTASKKNKVNNVSFGIKKEGEIVCLLGPSGIGKTTILRTIAGLQNLQSGKIILKGNVISSPDYNLEPEKRNIALCFQDNSLFPHYNVIDNINIGTKRNKNSKFNYTDSDLIDILHLGGLEKKYPHEISAGEAQRVSLARSLMSKPNLLLLDEPFSNIDQSLKDELQKKIKEILKKLNITTIIVTHDSYEAFYLSDKCGIILEQSLKQFDTPYNIYHYPNSTKIVKFLNRGTLIQAEVTGKNTLRNEELGTIKGNFIKKQSVGSSVQLLIQPEDLEHDDKSDLKLKVVDRKFRGTNFIYTLKTKNNQLIPIFVHSHHEHQHKIKEEFGIKTPIYVDHLVCF